MGVRSNQGTVSMQSIHCTFTLQLKRRNKIRYHLTRSRIFYCESVSIRRKRGARHAQRKNIETDKANNGNNKF